ncbi:Rha family transcriptional regulator [Pseudomonas tolaasii]|uniref:Rha family transcriptional regulator n=2 Tax=Pseudomonas tolaasii TaxID=29442 RepID=A0A7Y8ATK6_PSETO|nr:Rha family transcriptional regulator [Pseudomonas tolaasii]NWC24051.1 Rha family transcriptional regulator [Pseudomonas tolaasii]NWD38220.1 Rha family transcriptional regulator [Pseudomonas tolaasii]
MSSREIAELTGKRHDNVMADIRSMLSELKIDALTFQGIYLDSMNRQQAEYLLDHEHTDCLLTGYSAAMRMAVIKRWRELEAQAARPMTQAEITAANANHLVAVERQQREQQVALERIERRVEDLSQTTVWDHCPQNCQSLTRIKETMLARHGLSGAVVDYVLKVWPNQPNPAGMVRNGHEEALGSQYLVWSKSHVTAAFHRFVSESTMVTATQATHPYFEGRFRLVQKAQS